MKKVENIDAVRHIRAEYDEDNITVYQAFDSAIANAAVLHQKFVSPFKFSRMTWIKPSFLWMMYRCGWGTKEGQSNILKVRITRSGFDWALNNSCLSHFDAATYATYEEWKNRLNKSPVRIQWDPERDVYSTPLHQRSIQIGLTGIAVDLYVNEWILSINNITEECFRIKGMIDANDFKYQELLPIEKVYALDFATANVIGASI